MERILTKNINASSNSEKRKPLLLLGARQVGKTYLLKSFGEKHFRKTHTFNFEENPKLTDVFAQDLSLSEFYAT